MFTTDSLQEVATALSDGIYISPERVYATFYY